MRADALPSDRPPAAPALPLELPGRAPCCSCWARPGCCCCDRDMPAMCCTKSACCCCCCCGCMPYAACMPYASWLLAPGWWCGTNGPGPGGMYSRPGGLPGIPAWWQGAGRGNRVAMSGYGPEDILCACAAGPVHPKCVPQPPPPTWRAAAVDVRVRRAGTIRHVVVRVRRAGTVHGACSGAAWVGRWRPHRLQRHRDEASGQRRRAALGEHCAREGGEHEECSARGAQMRL